MIYVSTDRHIFDVPNPYTMFIVLDEDTGMYPNWPNIMWGSILLPPYEALSKMVDGDNQAFVSIYTHYLFSPECDDYITVIIAGWLLRNKDIVIYLDDSHSEMGILQTLLNHICTVYGVIISENSPTQIVHSSYHAYIISKFYMHDIISATDVFMMWPTNVRLLNQSEFIMKLLFDIKPAIPCSENKDPGLQYLSYYDYFSQMLEAAKAHKKVPKSPFVNQELGG